MAGTTNPPTPIKADEAPARPQLFAIMRNGHEVIRGAMIDIEAALNEDDMVEARRLWKGLMEWDNIHMKMEEGTTAGSSPVGMFRFLDEHCDGISEKNDLRHHHKHLFEYEQGAKDAFGSAVDVSEAVKIAFASFKKENLEHLEVKEKVMMPSIMQLMKSGKPMKIYMMEEIFPLIPEDKLEFFIKFANEILQKHEDGMPRVRVFDHALWSIAKPEQWVQWDQWIREVLSDDKYAELQASISAWKVHQQKGQQQEPVLQARSEETMPTKESVADMSAKEQAVVPPEASGCSCNVM